MDSFQRCRCKRAEGVFTEVIKHWNKDQRRCRKRAVNVCEIILHWFPAAAAWFQSPWPPPIGATIHTHTHWHCWPQTNEPMTILLTSIKIWTWSFYLQSAKTKPMNCEYFINHGTTIWQAEASYISPSERKEIYVLAIGGFRSLRHVIAVYLHVYCSLSLTALMSEFTYDWDISKLFTDMRCPFI